MKPRNFPQRKLKRQIDAYMREKPDCGADMEKEAFDAARMVRTKKRRSPSGRL